MSRDDFAALVAQMRAKQKQYFQQRTSDVLLESKELERRVDRALQEIREGRTAQAPVF